MRPMKTNAAVVAPTTTVHCSPLRAPPVDKKVRYLSGVPSQLVTYLECLAILHQLA
jgi:hypothetical protein